MTTLAANDRRSGPFVAGASQTDFPCDFPLFDARELRVYRERLGATVNGIPQVAVTVLTSVDFTILDQTDQAFTVHLLVPALANDVYSIVAAGAPQRAASFDGQALHVADLEDQLNLLTAYVQEVAAAAHSAVRVTPREAAGPMLPPLPSRPNLPLIFDPTGRRFRTDISLAQLLATTTVTDPDAPAVAVLYRVPELADFITAAGIADTETEDCTDAIQAFFDACDAAHCVGHMSHGRYLVRRRGIRVPQGSGGSHQPATPNSGIGGVTGAAGCNLLIPDDPDYNLVPVFIRQGNTRVDCHVIYVDRLAESSAKLDGDGKLIDADDPLTVYAPTHITDHMTGAGGVASATNVIGCATSGYMLGGTISLWMGEADAAEEVWAGPYTARHGCTTGGHRIDIATCAVDRDIAVRRHVVTSFAAAIDAGPQNWPDLQKQRSAAQQALIAAHAGDPTYVVPAPDTPLQKYMCDNAVVGDLKNRAIGFGTDPHRCSFRGRRKVWTLNAGRAPDAWAALAHAHDLAAGRGPGDDGYYPVDHQPDNGKFVATTLRGSVEGIPMFCDIGPDAWLQREEGPLTFGVNGICKHWYNDDQVAAGTAAAITDPVIREATDKARAGILNKHGDWVSVTHFAVGIECHVGVSIANGPLYVNTAAAPVRDWSFIGLCANLCHSIPAGATDDAKRWIQNYSGSVTISIPANLRLMKGPYGTTKLFRTPSLDLLQIGDGIRYIGWDTRTLPLDPDLCNIMAGFSPGGFCTVAAAATDPGDDINAGLSNLNTDN